MIKNKYDAPEILWLQWANDDGEVLHPEEQTWCGDKIFKYDIKYKRYDNSNSNNTSQKRQQKDKG